jgi:hypothetical protein
MPADLFIRTNAAVSLPVTATNSPTSFAATNLPLGLAIDPATGIVSGSTAGMGSVVVTLSATNTVGTGQAMVTFRLGTALALISANGSAPFVYSNLGRVDRLNASDWPTPVVPGPPTDAVVFARIQRGGPMQTDVIAVIGSFPPSGNTQGISSPTGFPPWTVVVPGSSPCTTSNTCINGFICQPASSTCSNTAGPAPDGTRIGHGGPTFAFAMPGGFLTQRSPDAFGTRDFSVLPFGGSLVVQASNPIPTSNSRGLVGSEAWVFSFKENTLRYSSTGTMPFIDAPTTTWPFSIALDFQVWTTTNPTSTTIYALGASSMPNTAFVSYGTSVGATWAGTQTVPFACLNQPCTSQANPYDSVGVLSVAGAALYVSVFGGLSGWELYRAPLTGGVPGPFTNVHQSQVRSSPKPGRVVQVSSGELLYVVDGQLFRSSNGGLSWSAVGTRIAELWPQLAPL